MSSTSYEQACAAHRWEVPAQYNIATDACDKHPRDKLAMVWEDWRGTERRVSWGELQDLAAKVANVLTERGVEREDRGPVAIAPLVAALADRPRFAALLGKIGLRQ